MRYICENSIESKGLLMNIEILCDSERNSVNASAQVTRALLFCWFLYNRAIRIVWEIMI